MCTLAQQLVQLLNDDDRLKEARLDAKKNARKFEAMQNDFRGDDEWGSSSGRWDTHSCMHRGIFYAICSPLLK